MLIDLAEFFDYKASGKVISIGYRIKQEYWGRGKLTTVDVYTYREGLLSLAKQLTALANGVPGDHFLATHLQRSRLSSLILSE